MGPTTDSCTAAISVPVGLLEHLVGESQKRIWNGVTKRLGGLAVDNQLKLRRLLDRKAVRAKLRWPVT